jgi:hypothetical protein
VTPRYSCSVEWIVPCAGVIRIHEGPLGRFGDPYVWCATLDRYGERGTIKGVCSPLPPGALRPMCDELYRLGMRTRAHERRGRSGWIGRKVIKPLHPPRP